MITENENETENQKRSKMLIKSDGIFLCERKEQIQKMT